MAENTRFIQVHPNAIIEWIWDDQFFFEDEYSIIKDIKNNETSFMFSSNAVEPDNYNKIPNQLYPVDTLINRYGVVDPNTKTFLQETKFVNNQPSKFNKVKIWFPINFTFPNTTGFYLRTYGLNYENAVEYNLSNFFIDITNQSDFLKIENENKPFRINEKLWGKSITIYVPALYDEALKRTNGSPTQGSINYNLTNGVLGLSQTSSIYIDFRFLTKKATILGETTYLTTPPLITSVPQAPEYNNLSVEVKPATDGDYFTINGLYNNTIGDFESFMLSLEQSGKKSYILYSITTYEENIPQETRDIYVYKNFYKGIDDYRPVFKFSNTTASIRVDMKLVNASDSSMITKTAEYTLVGNDVSKYGKYITPINISNAIKPKLYNSLPEQIVLPSKELLNSHLKRKAPTSPELRFIPYPVLTDVYNIVAQELSVNKQNTTYLGMGALTLKLTPFDNIIKLNIFKQEVNNVVPFSIPSSNSIIQMILKSDNTELRIPLYLESNEVNLTNGTLVFKIASSEQVKIKKIIQTSNIFYITITTNGIETSIYNGKVEILTTSNSNSSITNIASLADTTTLTQINVRAPYRKVPFNFTSKSVITAKNNLMKELQVNSLNPIQLKRLS